MEDQTVTIQLQTISTSKGIEVLAITAGIINGWTFKPDVLTNPQWDDEAQGTKALLTTASPLRRPSETWQI